MRLLICTQRVNTADTVMGFFVGWIKSFQTKTRNLKVICLSEGDHFFSDDVGIYPLSEKEEGKLAKALRFLFYLIKLHNQYDVVFVHMSKEFVWLGGWWWKLTGKKVIFWYNHPLGGMGARLAAWLSDEICFTSPQSYFARRGRGVAMPVGIDTEVFKPLAKTRKGFCYVGRVSPIKSVDLIIKAFASAMGDEELLIYGDVPARDYKYGEEVYKLAKNNNLVKMLPGQPNNTLPDIYNLCGAVINMTKGGSFDKVIFESMACGTPVISSNLGYKELLPEKFHSVLCPKEGDLDSLANCLKGFSSLSQSDRNLIGEISREIVVEKHSLDSLTNKVVLMAENLIRKK